MKNTISDAARNGDRVTMLVALRDRLADELDTCTQLHYVAPLANQLRLTAAELAEAIDEQVEQVSDEEKQLAAILDGLSEG